VGICGVRQNREGKLYSLVFDRAIALNIDPIEKKPFYHYLPNSRTFSVGTLGCNFRCANCQNYEISQVFGFKGKVGEYNHLSWGEKITPAEIVQGALRSDCKSIAYTYNEPTVFWEYAYETMKQAHAQNLKNVWVSNGFMSAEILNTILPYLDAINVDLKSIRDDFYKDYCGARLEPVLENLKKIAKAGVHLEVTTLVIPTLTDQPEELKKIARFIREKLGPEIPWHVSAFSPEISWKLKDLPKTTATKIKEARKIGKEAGLKKVYVGNV